MRNIKLKVKVPFLITVVVFVGFFFTLYSTLTVAQTRVTSAMTNQYIRVANLLAGRMEIALENSVSFEAIQAMIEKEVAEDDYMAYAVVIDKTVTAVAHSDVEKLGKSYAEDTSYTVPAATEGEIKTSKFWADVQNAWTMDVMVPIYVNGELYGSMDVGIYMSDIDTVLAEIRNRAVPISIIVEIVVCLISILIIRFELAPLARLVIYCKSMGKGDFTYHDDKLVESKNEVGTIVFSMNQMRSSLSTLISKTAEETLDMLDTLNRLTDSVKDTQKKAVEIAGMSGEAVKASERQVELTRANTSMTEEISKGIEDIAENIMNITTASSDTTRDAENGAHKVEQVVSQMHDIENKVSNVYSEIMELDKLSGNIQNIINIISDIASQTNLLALNASIEAARAGEHGRGFTVVAAEVSSLADQSKSATDEIAKIIIGIQESISKSVKLMEESNKTVKEGTELAGVAKDSFHGILNSITTVSDEMTNVSAVTEEISSSTLQLLEAIANITEISETMTNDTGSVSEQANVQQQLMDEVMNEVDHIAAVSKEVQKSIKKFKVEKI